MVGWAVNGCILWWTQGSQSTTGRRVAGGESKGFPPEPFFGVCGFDWPTP